MSSTPKAHIVWAAVVVAAIFITLPLHGIWWLRARGWR
jgi:hypothetical protein